jgi:RNA polymerase sigma-70 factor (sigma-E family)
MEEFESFVRARTHSLIRTAYLLAGDQQSAEDLVQEALIRTHRAWKRLRYSNPEAYTRKVMYHLQVSWWRRARWAEISTGDVPEPASPTGARDENHVAQLALRAALATLPPRQRAVVVLRYFEDLTEAATADVLGVSIGTVKSQTSKALAKLRAVTALREGASL